VNLGVAGGKQISPGRRVKPMGRYFLNRKKF